MKEIYRFSGEVYDCGDTKTIGQKGFQIKPLILKVVERGWTDHVQFDCVYDAVAACERLNKGDLVELEFTIGGRQWTNHSNEVKYFNKLEVKSITMIEKTDILTTEATETYKNADVPF